MEPGIGGRSGRLKTALEQGREAAVSCIPFYLQVDIFDWLRARRLAGAPQQFVKFAVHGFPSRPFGFQ